MYFIYFLIVVFSTIIGSQKNRPVLGFFMGLLFSLLGLIVIACIGKKEVDATK